MAHFTNDGYAALAISIICGVTPEQARVRLEHGVTRPRQPYGRNPAIDDEMLACRAGGMTYEEIAEQYGLTKGAVYRRVNK